MGRSLGAVAIVAAVSVSGCSAPSQVDLQREVIGLVKVGDDLSSAEARLRTAGFKCGPSYYANFGGHICNRNVSGPILSGCIERVEVAFDRARLRVSGIFVLRPACTGM